MSSFDEYEKAGAALTVTGPDDAKACGQAFPHNSPVEAVQSPKAEAVQSKSFWFDPEMEARATDRLIKGLVADPGLRALKDLLDCGHWGIVRLDEFTGSIVLETEGRRLEFDQARMTQFLLDLEDMGCRQVSRRKFELVVELVARNNSFDSVQEWLKRLPAWDGIARVDRLLSAYLNTAVGPYETAVSRYWCTAMVARLLFPGCKADMVPVMVGQQGVGKSMFLSTLTPTPEHCGEACLTSRGSDLPLKMLGKTTVVWEDMRGIKGKCDADEVKTFITSPWVETRSRTSTGIVRYERRFIIVATANDREILRDPTGHRRYLPFEVTGQIPLAKLRADKLQIWAEALQIVRDRVGRGESPVDFQDAERLAKRVHPTYLKEGRWIGEKMLLDWLDRCLAPFSTEEALDAIGFLPAQSNLRDKRDMSTTLRQLGYVARPTRVPGWRNPQRRWHPLVSRVCIAGPNQLSRNSGIQQRPGA